MKFLNLLSILLGLSLSQATKAAVIRNIPDSDSKNVRFLPGVNRGKGWMSFYANPSTHAVSDIYDSPSSWKAVDTGKLTTEGEFNAFQIFQFGKGDWDEVQKTCFKPASICLDNNFSNKPNSETIQSSVTSSYSKSNGMTITGTVGLDIEFIKMSTSISGSVTQTWTESTTFTQGVACNVDPKDTVQTLAQVPYTLIEGYYVDAWCGNYGKLGAGWYTCWTNLDGNDRAIINYGNMTIPMKDHSMVKMGCFSKKILQSIGHELPCENGGQELCLSDDEVKLAFVEPAKMMELRILK